MTATAGTTGPAPLPSIGERRRQALQRLNRPPRERGPTRPRVRRASGRDEERARRPLRYGSGRFWDRLDGPPPIGFLVIGVVVAIFVMLGLVMVLSASSATEISKGRSPYRIFNRQVIWAGVGLVGLGVGSRMNLTWIRRLAVPGMLVTLAAMATPFLGGLGETINDARAWVTIGAFSVQPSELLKLGVVVFLADLLARRFDERHNLRKSLVPALLVAIVACGACLVQGDLGSAIVMFVVIASIAFVAGVPITPLAGLGIGALFVTFAFALSSARRYNRFTAFLDITGHKDTQAYQTYQGLLSIADGGLLGSGIGAGNGKLGYLPLAHSDFIFAVVADELGFVGSLAVIGGFMLIVWFGVSAALSAPDRFGMLIAGGVSAWLGAQAVVNLGGVSGLLPVTGLTLPFFSAGGSSLFVSMTAAGLLLNVARRGR